MDTKQADEDERLASEATQKRSGCQHHWVIDPPEGPASKGVCRSCGEERDFPNAPEGRHGAYVPSRVKTTEGSSTEEEERGQHSEDAAK